MNSNFFIEQREPQFRTAAQPWTGTIARVAVKTVTGLQKNSQHVLGAELIPESQRPVRVIQPQHDRLVDIFRPGGAELGDLTPNVADRRNDALADETRDNRE